MFYAQVRLHNPVGETAEGDMIVLTDGLEWQTVLYLEPDQCDDFETMCRRCAHSWEVDHEVRLPSLI